MRAEHGLNAGSLPAASVAPKPLDRALAISLVLASGAASLWVPALGYLLAAVALWNAAQSDEAAPRWAAVVAYAHAAALCFASRSFGGESVDFSAYFDVYQAFCRGGDADSTWLAFGSEIGLPLVYRIFSRFGLCGLGIHGLAYLQTLLVLVAMQGLLWAICRRRLASGDRALVFAGAVLMVSVFYATQLSRQTLSSLFVLHAVFLARSRIGWSLSLVGATLCHTTGPLLIGLAWLFRVLPLWCTLGLPAVLWWLGSTIDGLFDLVRSFADYVAVFDKLAYYADLAEGASVASDNQAVVYLLLSAAPLLLARGRSDPERGSLRIALGFGLLALVLLPLPLAATRLSLPFAFFGGGFLLFSALTRLPRPLAGVLLVALLAFRVQAVVASDPTVEHGLWSGYPAASWLPGYYIGGFLD